MASITFGSTSWLIAKNQGLGSSAIFKANNVQFFGGLTVNDLTTLYILAILFEMKLNSIANNFGNLWFGKDLPVRSF